MISRRGFFRGLLAAATTVVARAYVPSVLTPAASEHDKLLRRYAALKDARGEWMAYYNEQIARMMIYGDGWQVNHDTVYGVGPGQEALRSVGLLEDVAVIDPWSEVDDQIASLG